MNIKKKLVSILVNNYNNEKYIKNCINSCLDQTYKNIEVIIYDDNSSDRSISIINKLKECFTFVSICNKSEKLLL